MFFQVTPSVKGSRSDDEADLESSVSITTAAQRPWSQALASLAELLDEEACKLVFETLTEHSDGRIRAAASKAFPETAVGDSCKARGGFERAIRRTPTMEAIKAMSMEATDDRELAEYSQETTQWPSLLTVRRNAGRKTTMEELKMIRAGDDGARHFQDSLEDLGDALLLASVHAQQQVCRVVQAVIPGGPASMAPTQQITEV
eukprot:TRINITY_DN43625_c0_g1_i1.p2 TRINITY_DN43625_c0_g1~~TRINITY_DN43625_c0_g1_i1.p2  ORF type:complete len:220 (-),score=58.19 TRINITY_DN43625_c0_g1_i1:450-1058(-)